MALRLLAPAHRNICLKGGRNEPAALQAIGFYEQIFL